MTSNPSGEAGPRVEPLRDQEAIERCLGGDANAFGALVVRYQDRIFNACVRIVGHRETAREMAQEAFLRAFERLRTFRQGSRFSTWLFAIAINQCRSELRRRKTKKHRPPLSLDAGRSDDGGGGWEPPSAEPDPSAGVLASETGRRVEAELAELPKKYRIPVVLRDVEGMSYEEIAVVIDAPVGTVRSRIHRGRQVLRERLSDLMSP
jgi:RNA polymerase sigma-70 factor, ECF subfamily